MTGEDESRPLAAVERDVITRPFVAVAPAGGTSCARRKRTPPWRVHAAVDARRLTLPRAVPCRRPRCDPAHLRRPTSATATPTPASCTSRMVRIPVLFGGTPSARNRFGSPLTAEQMDARPHRRFQPVSGRRVSRIR